MKISVFLCLSHNEGDQLTEATPDAPEPLAPALPVELPDEPPVVELPDEPPDVELPLPAPPVGEAPLVV